MPVVLRATHTDLNPTVLAKDIYAYVMPNLIAASEEVVDSRFKDIRVGDTINIVVTSRMAPSQKSTGSMSGGTWAEAGDLTPAVMSGLAGGRQTVYIDQYWANSYQIEIYEDSISQFDIDQLYNQAVLDGLAVRLDTTVTDEGATFSANTVGSVGIGLDDFQIRTARNKLTRGDIPRSPAWNALIYPDEATNLLGNDRYTRSDYVGNTDGVTKGELTKLYGVRFHETTQVKASGAGHIGYMLHKEAIALVIREEPFVESLNMPLSLSKVVSVGAIWGVRKTRDTFGVLLNGL